MSYTPIGVIMLVGIGLAAVLSFNNHQQANGRYAAARQDYEQSKRIVPPDATAHREYTGAQSERDEWRAEQNLESQREMARTSWWVMVATWFGVFLLGITLWETTRTTIAAAEAATASKQAVKLSEKTAEQQLRAYLGVVKFDLGGPDLNAKSYVPQNSNMIGATCRNFLQVTTKNFGQTPASDVLVCAYWTCTTVPHRLPPGYCAATELDAVNIGDVRVSASRFMLDRNQEHCSHIAIWDLTPWRQAKAGKVNLYVHGRVFYTDAFGKTRRRFFCFQWEPAFTKGNDFVPYEEYNGEDDRPLVVPSVQTT